MIFSLGYRHDSTLFESDSSPINPVIYELITERNSREPKLRKIPLMTKGNAFYQLHSHRNSAYFKNGNAHIIPFNPNISIKT